MKRLAVTAALVAAFFGSLYFLKPRSEPTEYERTVRIMMALEDEEDVAETHAMNAMNRLHPELKDNLPTDPYKMIAELQRRKREHPDWPDVYAAELAKVKAKRAELKRLLD